MDLIRNGRPRVVVTGLGAVTALGNAKSLWEALKTGTTGIRKITTFPTDYVPITIGAEVRDFDSSQYIDHKEARRMGRATQFATVAAHYALEDSGMSLEDIDRISERVGVVVGTTFGSHELTTDATHEYLMTHKKPNPFTMVNSLPNMPAHYISRFMRALGPLETQSTACAAGTQGVGAGAELIKNGRADVVFAGGVDALLKDYTIAGFSAMKALASEYNDDPARASRPFDKNRSGFVIGEGSAMLVLESLAHAIKRGARIYAEVLGFASSSDGYHVAALDPSASGATRSMRWALEDAHLNPQDVQYVNAHGTSTQQNDAMETQAIKNVFGEHAYKMAISSTKSMLGHAFGASGAIEAIASVMTLVEQFIHPTINYETPDPDCDLDYVPNEGREVKDLKAAISNSFGLGGQNASVVFGTL
mgnify:CR=1 FL=1|jgi:3-oxoacyl-[acyl-carrier-protein] synthase II